MSRNTNNLAANKESENDNAWRTTQVKLAPKPTEIAPTRYTNTRKTDTPYQSSVAFNTGNPNDSNGMVRRTFGNPPPPSSNPSFTNPSFPNNPIRPSYVKPAATGNPNATQPPISRNLNSATKPAYDNNKSSSSNTTEGANWRKQ